MKKVTIGFLALMLIGIVAASASTFGWRFGKIEAIEEALENNDFNEWKTAMADQLTEENFNRMMEKHQQRAQFREHKEEMVNAIESGDYESWAALVKYTPMAGKLNVITADNFDQFVKMHNARQNGDYETARSIASDLGLDCQGGIRHRFKMGG